MKKLVRKFLQARALTKAIVLAALLGTGMAAPQALVLAGLVSDGAGELAE